jgi:hypothetical protein
VRSLVANSFDGYGFVHALQSIIFLCYKLLKSVSVQEVRGRKCRILTKKLCFETLRL